MISIDKFVTQFMRINQRVVLLYCFIFIATIAVGQTRRWVSINNPNYDQRKVTFGLSIALHTTTLRVKYSNAFATQGFDTLFAVEPDWSPGFTLGALVNLRLGDFFDLRSTPQFSFYEHRVHYLFTDRTPTLTQVVESVLVELPVLLKYKSQRRGNIRMYMIGGIKPGIEASGRRGIENVSSSLEIKDWNLSADFGFGFDLYYPLFKFSPEIRFSKGCVNMLADKTNVYGQPLDRITTNSVHIYFIFQ